jgi:hypothetical protein
MQLKIKTTASSILFLATALVIVPFLGSLIVLGAGYGLNRIAGIGLLPGTMIFIATLFTGLVSTGLAFMTSEIRSLKLRLPRDDDESWDDYDDDEDDDYDEDEDEELEALEKQASDWAKKNLNLNPASQAAPKVGRNQPCPCGSQKKYKACCLWKQEIVPDEIPF